MKRNSYRCMAKIPKRASVLAPLTLSACSTFNALALPETKGVQGGTAELTHNVCSDDRDAIIAIAPTGVIASVLFDQASSFAQSALQKKKNRFKATYSAKISVDRLVAGNCIRLTRTAGDAVVADVEVKVVQRDANAAVFSVEHVKFEKFAASTNPENGTLSANVSVSASLSYVNPKQFDGPLPLTQVTLPIASGNFTIGATSGSAFDDQTSPLFPFLPTVPTDIAISVTEIGRGDSQLKAGLDGFDANAGALKKILGIEE